MKVFMDTSFFIDFFRGKKEARKIYEQIVHEELYTSLNVLEETTYILIKLKASDLTGIKKHYDLIKELKKNEKVYRDCFNLSKDFFSSLLKWSVKVLPITLSYMGRCAGSYEKISLIAKRRFNRSNVQTIRNH